MKIKLFLRAIGAILTVLLIFGNSPRQIQAQGLPPSVRAVAWSPNGNMIAGAGNNGFLRIWDATGQTLVDIQGLTGVIYSVAWSPDSNRIATAGPENLIRVWNAQNGLLLATIQDHADTVLSLAWSPDGNSLASVSFDETYTLRTWNASTYQPQAVLPAGNLYRVSWSPDGTRLAVTTVNRVGVFDSSLNIPLSEIRNYVMGPTGLTTAVAWNGDSRRLAIGREDGTIYIWDTLDYIQLSILSGHTGWIEALSWHPDGNRLASLSFDGTIRIWDTTNGQVVSTFSNPHEYLLPSISWDPSGNNLAYGGEGEVVHIVQLPSYDPPPAAAIPAFAVFTSFAVKFLSPKCE